MLDFLINIYDHIEKKLNLVITINDNYNIYNKFLYILNFIKIIIKFFSNNNMKLIFKIKF